MPSAGVDQEQDSVTTLTRQDQSVSKGRLALAGLLFLGFAGLLVPQAARAQETPLFTFAQISDPQVADVIEQARFEEVLDTLAAALASGGHFGKASGVLGEAIALVSQDRERVRALRETRARYRQRAERRTGGPP